MSNPTVGVAFVARQTSPDGRQPAAHFLWLVLRVIHQWWLWWSAVGGAVLIIAAAAAAGGGGGGGGGGRGGGSGTTIARRSRRRRAKVGREGGGVPKAKQAIAVQGEAQVGLPLQLAAHVLGYRLPRLQRRQPEGLQAILLLLLWLPPPPPPCSPPHVPVVGCCGGDADAGGGWRQQPALALPSSLAPGFPVIGHFPLLFLVLDLINRGNV